MVLPPGNYRSKGKFYRELISADSAERPGRVVNKLTGYLDKTVVKAVND